MQRLPWLDRCLVFFILPIWAVALTLHVRQVWRGELAHVGFYVTSPVDERTYPTISAFRSGHEELEESFAIGDRIVALNDRDLAGVGPYRFFATALEELAHVRRDAHSLTVQTTVERNGRRFEVPLPFIPVQFPWRMLPLTTAFVVTAVLILLQRPGTPIATAFFLGATLFSLHWTWFFGGNVSVTYAWYATFFVSSALMLPAMLRAAALFPPEAAPRRSALWPWLFVVYAPISLTGAVGAPLPPTWGLPGVYAFNVLFIVALLLVLTRNYAHAGARGRRQLRWGVLGMYLGLAPMLVANVVLLARPQWWWLLDLSATAEILIPFCILIAIVRSNLYDIDQLITAAIAYSVLSVILLGTALIVVPRVAEAASSLIGLEATTGAPIMNGVLAVALFLSQRAFRPTVERVFFRERHSLHRGIQSLLDDILRSTSHADLFALTTRRVGELFRPSYCALYTAGSREYRLAAVTRSTVPTESVPSLGADGWLVAQANATAGAFDAEEWRRERRSARISMAEAALLNTLAASVAFRVGRNSHGGLVVVGRKQSGDVYSTGDLALLTAVASAVSDALSRLDRERRTAAGAVLLPEKYEMVRELGRGGMGSVYLVRHATLGTLAAIKMLPEHLASDTEFVTRFQREARVMAQLRHPNIVEVRDIDEQGDVHFLVMEYVAGTPLNQMLREAGRPPLAEALRVADEIGRALAFAHEHAVVHRDIKPGNILIEHNTGRAVVTDFGIAKVLASDQSLTQTGAVYGTPKYCAPEQLRGESDVGVQADVYSLGMVVFELVTGKQFFHGVDDQQIIAAAAARIDAMPVECGPENPTALRDLIARAVASDRARRFHTVTDLLTELDLIRSMLPREVRPWTTVGVTDVSIAATSSASAEKPFAAQPTSLDAGTTAPADAMTATQFETRTYALGTVIGIAALIIALFALTALLWLLVATRP